MPFVNSPYTNMTSTEIKNYEYHFYELQTGPNRYVDDHKIMELQQRIRDLQAKLDSVGSHEVRCHVTMPLGGAVKLVFEERGKQYPEVNLSKQGRDLTTNLTYMWHRCRDLNLGHIGGRRVLSQLCHSFSPCSLAFIRFLERSVIDGLVLTINHLF